MTASRVHSSRTCSSRVFLNFRSCRSLQKPSFPESRPPCAASRRMATSHTLQPGSSDHIVQGIETKQFDLAADEVSIASHTLAKRFLLIHPILSTNPGKISDSGQA